MERLTEKGYQYHSCDFMEDGTFEWANKLREYEDAEEQGLLLRLPCKVGDTVWFVREITSANKELIETEVEKVILKKRGLHIKLLCNSFYETSCNSIGKTVFFTREEAEQALADMKKGKEIWT